MCKACDYTIHGAQAHFGWDNSLPPALRVAPAQSREMVPEPASLRPLSAAGRGTG